MDYGAYLKVTVGNLNKKSKSYNKQSNFKESNRYVRGAILRALINGSHTKTALFNTLKEIEKKRVKQALTALLNEGLVQSKNNMIKLP